MKKILVVDDQADIRKMLRLTLNSRYQVIEAVNAAEASDRVAEECPDLVLLDIMMPGINGLEWCVMLKQQVHIKPVKIIFLSARGQTEDVKAGMAAGADGYIIKPFSPINLRKVVEQHLDEEELAAR